MTQPSKDLFESNIQRIRLKSDELANRLSNHIPNVQLTIQDNDHYLYEGKRLVRGMCSKKYEHTLLESDLKSPNRLLMPAGKLEAKVEREQLKVYESMLKVPQHSYYPSQKYDDAEGALHTGFFVSKLAINLDDRLSIADTPVVNNPYYLTLWGVGLGTHIKPLLDRYMPQHILIIEDNIDLLYWSFHVVDWTDILDTIEQNGTKITFCFNQGWQAIFQAALAAVNDDCAIAIDGTIAVLNTESSSLLRAYRKFNSSEIGNLVSFTGFTCDEYNMVKNSFRNLKLGNGHVLRDFDSDHDVPVAICASGPSLQNHIEWLRSNQEKCIIVACGSSLPVLINNNIIPDYQLVIERDKYMYEVHSNDIAAGLDYSNVSLIASSTIWPGISAFFKDTYWFFRSALTPVSLFANQISEVVGADGPQTVNLGITVANLLKAKNAFLFGVDLGAASPDNPRVAGAHGDTVRNLTIPARGNKGRTVFTDNLMQVVKLALEGALQASECKYYNCSDGVYIQGAIPADISDIESLACMKSHKNVKVKVKEAFSEQMPIYTNERFEDQWFSVDLRQISYTFFLGLKQLFFSSASGWNHSNLKSFYNFLDYSKSNLRDQTMQRLVRGDVMRWVMTIDNAYKRIENIDEKQEFILAAINIASEEIDRMQSEFISLLDELELEYSAS